MIHYFTHFIVILTSVIILITSVGILRTNNTLQKLHFTTIIDIICFPLIFIAIMLTLGTYHTKLVYGLIIVIILSPISAYFMGKLYYTLYKHQLKADEKPKLNQNSSV